MEKIELNGKNYILEDDITKTNTKTNTKWLKYCIVRTNSAWVFAWYVKEIKWKEGTILNARRLWYWDGACSLSQLAVDWVSKPENCKFPCEVSSILLTEIIEIIECTTKAFNSIKNVKIWKS